VFFAAKDLFLLFLKLLVAALRLINVSVTHGFMAFHGLTLNAGTTGMGMAKNNNVKFFYPALIGKPSAQDNAPGAFPERMIL